MTHLRPGENHPGGWALRGRNCSDDVCAAVAAAGTPKMEAGEARCGLDGERKAPQSSAGAQSGRRSSEWTWGSVEWATVGGESDSRGISKDL